MVDLTQHKAGIEAARQSLIPTCLDPRAAFMEMLAGQGMRVPRALTVGHIDRIDGVEDKRGKKSAWYVYNEIEDSQHSGQVIGLGAYGDWKLGISETWCSRSQHQMSTAESLYYHSALEAMRVQRELETAERHEAAAKQAFEIWSEAKDATKHPYLKKKNVKSNPGLKLANDGRLIIPMAIENEIVSLQFINGAGDKRFLTGGKVEGASFVIEGKTDIVYVAEGYSTAASVHEATGRTIYIAFNTNNFYEVSAYAKSSNPNSRLVVVGDDDFETKGNPGRTRAEQIADGLNIECVFPPGFNDFNDMHTEQGIESLKKYFNPEKLKAYQPKELINGEMPIPGGVLGDIINYYSATAGNSQPGFAIQTAIAIVSIILGRSYKTSLENFTSLYLLNVAKSGTGKEHAKTVIEKILYQSGLGHLIAGDGYTSAGAVFSTLLDRPCHISVIDEFGRYLEAGRDLKGGSSHQREANTKLMEAIGRCHAIIRPPSYSSMTLKKDAAKAIKNRLVHNPAITLLTMTTPDTLFSSLDMASIKDGFINRFIISLSNAKRTKRKHKPPVNVPERITRWIKNIQARNDMPHVASEPANPIVIEFSLDALVAQDEFQDYCIETADNLEKFGMAELVGRANEMAIRLSLISALATNPEAVEISGDDMAWGIAYIKHCLEGTIDKLKISVSHSGFEHSKKEILSALRSHGEQGITWSKMQRVSPYSIYKPKELREILSALKDADLATDTPFQPKQGGRPSIKWVALE